MSNPFLPLSAQPQAEWSAKDHQQAANFHWYEMQGYTEAAFQRGECDANYKPLWSLHRAAWMDHQSKARAKRLASA